MLIKEYKDEYDELYSHRSYMWQTQILPQWAGPCPGYSDGIMLALVLHWSTRIPLDRVRKDCVTGLLLKWLCSITSGLLTRFICNHPRRAIVSQLLRCLESKRGYKNVLEKRGHIKCHKQVAAPSCWEERGL